VVDEPAGNGAIAWRTIDELAGLVGVYCWVEQRIFEMTGVWATGAEATGEDVAELRVWSAATSRRHGTLAGRWAEHLPVRAGIEPSALVEAPAEPQGLAEALEELSATKELALGVSALSETVLPWVAGVYGSHLASATPVSEASVMEVLVEARREGSAEIQGGRALLGRLAEGGKPSGHRGEALKRAFVPGAVSPAVRPG
jgi:hypothetical protein